jgi:murein endopeptidase
VLAAAMFVAMVAGGVAYVVTVVRSEDPATAEAAESAVDVIGSAPAPIADVAAAVEPAQPPIASADPELPRSLEEITWTVATPATMAELAQTWSLPRDTLVRLNPKLSADEPLAAGTKVVVHKGSIGESESVGSPNDGHLVGGIPFPEGRTWRLPPDRSRSFGTGETITGVLAALDADAAKYPGAAPIQLGEISARKGGPIYGHQSHQAGRDIDIRLAIDPTGKRFDGARNWSLVKTLLESGEVVSIFLNRTQQVWLRAAAEADVGAAGADRYFALIKHEPGHLIHIHVRFRCPDSARRCVVYSLDESDAAVAKLISKLPKSSGGGGGGLIREKGKLPTLRPKTGPKTSPKTSPKLPPKKPPRPPTKGR